MSLGAPLQVGSLAQQPTKPALYLPRPDPHSKGKRHPWAPQTHEKDGPQAKIRSYCGTQQASTGSGYNLGV